MVRPGLRRLESCSQPESFHLSAWLRFDLGLTWWWSVAELARLQEGVCKFYWSAVSAPAMDAGFSVRLWCLWILGPGSGRAFGPADPHRGVSSWVSIGQVKSRQCTFTWGAGWLEYVGVNFQWRCDVVTLFPQPQVCFRPRPSWSREVVDDRCSQGLLGCGIRWTACSDWQCLAKLLFAAFANWLWRCKITVL